MGGGVSKQFLPLGGIPILARTLLALEASRVFAEMVVVVPAEDLERCQEEIIEPYGISRAALVAGGNERQDSVYNGLKRASADAELILIHDGVRPFLSAELIWSIIQETRIHRATVVAIPAKETIKEVDEEGFAVVTPERRRLWISQTPQTFSHELIREAHERARTDGFHGTDDASLVERLGVKVKVIPGPFDNIKITTAEDLALAEWILKRREALASGAGL